MGQADVIKKTKALKYLPLIVLSPERFFHKFIDNNEWQMKHVYQIAFPLIAVCMIASWLVPQNYSQWYSEIERFLFNLGVFFGIAIAIIIRSYIANMTLKKMTSRHSLAHLSLVVLFSTTIPALIGTLAALIVSPASITLVRLGLWLWSLALITIGIKVLSGKTLSKSITISLTALLYEVLIYLAFSGIIG